jgi:hypothetical protein
MVLLLADAVGKVSVDASNIRTRSPLLLLLLLLLPPPLLSGIVMGIIFPLAPPGSFFTRSSMSFVRRFVA